MTDFRENLLEGLKKICFDFVDFLFDLADLILRKAYHIF